MQSVPSCKIRPASPPAVARYVAGLILGAGVFTIPFEIATVGLIPMAVLLLLAGSAAHWLYPRMIVQDGGAFAGTAPLSTAVVHAGAGNGGRFLALAGASFHGFPTLIGYLVLGAAALDMVQEILASADEPAVVALLVAVGCYFGSQTPIVPHVARRVAALTLRWFVGLGISSAFGLTGVAQTTVIAVGYVAGVLYLLATGPEPANVEPPSGLSLAHDRSVATLRVQLAVMAAVGLLLVGLALGADLVRVPTLVGNPSWSNIAQAVGVAVFSFNAAGFTNTSVYSVMRSPEGASTVTRLSIRSVWLIQFGWLLAAGLIVSNEALVELDAAGSYTTVGMIDTVRSIVPVVGDGLEVVGALLVLSAVSAGSAGGIEMMSREFQATVPALLGVPRPKMLERLHYMILGATTPFAIWAAVQGVSVNSVIAVAGLNGSVVLLFLLPMLSGRGNVAPCWLATALAGLVAILAVVVAPGRPQIVLAVLMGGVVFGLTAFNACSVAKGPTPSPGGGLGQENRSPQLSPTIGAK